MSIAVLNQVYDEMRRLAIAGSVVAGGDFRLKKLIAPLEQAGAKAPVFAKAAQAVKTLVESNEQSSPQALLDLCTLVNAVLYTQGETGVTGEYAPLETTDLGAQTTQAGARVLKPLLEALSTTGSGRLEIIRDAHESGTFRDLRLVKPALQALDDVYPEIGDFVADKVLPMYGKAILPTLKLKFDIKGKAGHVRRLSLMHRLDPAGTRDTVKQALESGSKEIRTAAIECLGTDPEDLTFLLEQMTAKAKEVRGAALKSLAKLDDQEAIKALKNALSGSDIELAVGPVRESSHPDLLKFIIDEAEREVQNACDSEDTKAIAKSADRLESLLHCLDGRSDNSTEAFLLKCFSRREQILAVKCEDVGKTINHSVLALMSKATKKTRHTLAESHATLEADVLQVALEAARHTFKPAEIYEMFSPYLVPTKDGKKKKKDFDSAKSDAIAKAIAGRWQGLSYAWNWRFATDDDEELKSVPWDPRWLDLAVATNNIDLVCTLARPGHEAANSLLSDAFTASLKKSKDMNDCSGLLLAIVRVQHPEATNCVIAVLSKHAALKSKYHWGIYWIGRLIPQLPKSAVPALEELLPSLHEKAVDELVEHLEALKNKP